MRKRFKEIEIVNQDNNVYIKIIKNKQDILIDIKDILYITWNKTYSDIHCKDKIYLVSDTVISIERKLKDHSIRVSKFTLVFKDKIEYVFIKDCRDSYVKVIDKSEPIKIGKCYFGNRDNAKKMFNGFNIITAEIQENTYNELINIEYHESNTVIYYSKEMESSGSISTTLKRILFCLSRYLRKKLSTDDMIKMMKIIRSSREKNSPPKKTINELLLYLNMSVEINNKVYRPFILNEVKSYPKEFEDY